MNGGRQFFGNLRPTSDSSLPVRRETRKSISRFDEEGPSPQQQWLTPNRVSHQNIYYSCFYFLRNIKTLPKHWNNVIARFFFFFLKCFFEFLPFVPWDFFAVRDMHPVLASFPGADDDIPCFHFRNGLPDRFVAIKNFYNLRPRIAALSKCPPRSRSKYSPDLRCTDLRSREISCRNNARRSFPSPDASMCRGPSACRRSRRPILKCK